NMPINTAVSEARSIIGTIGFFRNAPYKIMANGSSITRFQLYIESSSLSNPWTLSAEADEYSVFMPTKNQTAAPTIDAGTVVHSICRICAYRLTSTTSGARFVVSD